MKRHSHLPFCLLSLLPLSLIVAAACDPGASHDEIWLPPEDLGKADVATVDGNDIASVFADPDATYLSSRSIDSLWRVGAIDGPIQNILERADGIIAALPKDGRVELAELVRLESPSFFNALHPEEQAALADAWPYMQSTDRETVVKNAGSLTADLPGGVYVVERYTDGVRSGSGFLDLAGIDKEDTAKDITPFIDHALETPTGALLTRNVQATSWTPLTARSLATFTWDLGEVPPSGTVDSNILARVATPQIALLPGRYELALEAGTLWIDIYPQGAVRYGLDGQMAGLAFRLASSGKFWQAAYETTADLRVILDADDLLLQVFKGGYPSLTSYYNEPLLITDRIE